MGAKIFNELPLAAARMSDNLVASRNIIDNYYA